MKKILTINKYLIITTLILFGGLVTSLKLVSEKQVTENFASSGACGIDSASCQWDKDADAIGWGYQIIDTTANFTVGKGLIRTNKVVFTPIPGHNYKCEVAPYNMCGIGSKTAVEKQSPALPTATSAPTPTVTLTPTAILTPSITPSVTISLTPTAISSPSVTLSPTIILTATPSPTPNTERVGGNPTEEPTISFDMPTLVPTFSRLPDTGIGDGISGTEDVISSKSSDLENKTNIATSSGKESTKSGSQQDKSGIVKNQSSPIVSIIKIVVVIVIILFIGVVVFVIWNKMNNP